MIPAVVFDIETERLHKPEKIWVVIAKEVESGKVHQFLNVHEAPGAFSDFARTVRVWIGHNILGFDVPVLNRISGYEIPVEDCIDTLVTSRLLNSSLPGGHSLEAWGERLGYPKIDFKDFSALTPELINYCKRDVDLTFKLYRKFLPYINSPRWKKALRVEHDLAVICRDMHDNGFAFDIEAAKALHTKIVSELSDLTNQLQAAFPPRSQLIREITPKATKHGTIHKGDFRWAGPDLTAYSVGEPFSLVEFIPFNPGSPKQVVERLNEAGWKPYEKTKGHIQAERNANEARLEHFRTYGWKVSEANLATLPKSAPEASQKLVRWLLLDSRRSTLEEWFNAYDEGSQRIHGSFTGIGAWTHRMSHSAPNMANIPAGDTAYAHDMRSMWKVPMDRYLVGVDADGIQLRILAHYMQDPAFTEALINGRKEDGTDAHSMNQRALGVICKSRDDAKTFIYAWLLGAGVAKVAQILGCTLREAKEAMNNFLNAYPGLKDVKYRQIPYDASKGYFVGLDGRLVMCDNEHLMLAGYLQNGETVVMRHANVLWRRQLRAEGLPFWQVNFVHDEWQTETVRDMAVATRIAEVQADSIRIVGEQLGVRCPLAGSIMNSHKQIAIGDNWSYTH